MAVELYEDKQFYPEAEKVFGKDVEALVEEEDHQPITKPIIEPIVDKFSQIYAKKVKATFYTDEYLCQVLARP